MYTYEEKQKFAGLIIEAIMLFRAIWECETAEEAATFERPLVSVLDQFIEASK